MPGSDDRVLDLSHQSVLLDLIGIVEIELPGRPVRGEPVCLDVFEGRLMGC